MTLRPARPDDAAAIRAVLTAAFPTTDEAALVDELRSDGDLILEWVAEQDGEIVGAIQYSLLLLRRESQEDDGRAAALAPVAVRPELQSQGIGGRLIRATLDELKTDPWLDAVLVLGHPDYYPRFGFSAETAGRALIDPFDAGPAFMALALQPEGLAGAPARPVYAAAFGLDLAP